jgi:quercetin dioxygenase-like cupin family protein
VHTVPAGEEPRLPAGGVRDANGRVDLQLVNLHVGSATGESSCQVEHVGLVLSGEAVAKMDDGREVVMHAGDFFYIPPGHDSWVVGQEPYVSLHIMGSEEYATT